jgi:hypothetical protein
MDGTEEIRLRAILLCDFVQAVGVGAGPVSQHQHDVRLLGKGFRFGVAPVCRAAQGIVYFRVRGKFSERVRGFVEHRAFVRGLRDEGVCFIPLQFTGHSRRVGDNKKIIPGVTGNPDNFGVSGVAKDDDGFIIVPRFRGVAVHRLYVTAGAVDVGDAAPCHVILRCGRDAVPADDDGFAVGLGVVVDDTNAVARQFVGYGAVVHQRAQCGQLAVRGFGQHRVDRVGHSRAKTRRTRDFQRHNVKFLTHSTTFSITSSTKSDFIFRPMNSSITMGFPILTRIFENNA